MSLANQFLFWGQQRIEKGAWYFAPLSWIWGFFAWCKNGLYSGHLLPVAKVHRPVVSIGNIVAGGTGKTPLVYLLASQFSHRNVAILSRGYGAIPDEPLLLQKRLSKAKVYVGKNRVQLAQRAVAEGAQLLILDDGFQYRKLHRDFDLVILSGVDPFGKGHYLPWGFLRDSPKRLTHASALFISGMREPQNALRGFPLRPISPPPIALQTHVDRIVDLEGRTTPPIRGWPVAIFCGIAKPAAFKKTVIDQGAQVVSVWFFADHARIDPKDLRAFARHAQSLGAQALLCTEKDAVKLDPDFRAALGVFVVEISLRVVGGQDVWEKLIAKIEEKIDTISAYE